jgi:Photosynthetic reaction centre cytochrome C subunit
MRPFFVGLVVLAAPSALASQASGRWPPDSLVNVQVIPRTTPVMEVVGAMRNITFGLGVRCQFCHVGEEGMPLERFDFPSDEKRTKLVARQMMRMVQEINRRLDTIPGRASTGLQVSCATCHRGVSRPLPLANLLIDAALAAGSDSAIRAYRGLRQRYYGRDAYDFGETSLNTAAFRLGRAGKYDEAFALLRLNEEMFPNSSGMYVFRGNISLMKGDTTAAVAAFREAVRRDPSNGEARGRLQAIGRQP